MAELNSLNTIADVSGAMDNVPALFVNPDERSELSAIAMFKFKMQQAKINTIVLRFSVKGAGDLLLVFTVFFIF